MIKLLEQQASEQGYKLQLITIERLQDTAQEIKAFEESEELNGFQKWIVNGLYQFEVPKVNFEIKSILLVALRHPAYAKVDFQRQNKTYQFLSLVMPDFDQYRLDLSELALSKNYHISLAQGLPLKRLAAQSGLAAYGRNNICYVDGMGSYLSLEAYFTDIPCVMDEWTAVRHADSCANCNVCFHNCPTGAIRADRFLIDNERCLSAMNEISGEFPDWLPKSVHHCLYDCLKCQVSCPMNKPYEKDILEGIGFDEDETEILLNGRPYDSFSPAMKDKTKLLGLSQWLDAIPRNLKILMEISG